MLKVEPAGEANVRHRISINGTEIKGIRSLEVHYDIHELPTAGIEMYSGADLDQLVDIGVDLHPESLQECIKGIQFELKVDDEFRRAMIVGIYDALAAGRFDQSIPTDVLAERIFNMVFFGN